MHICTAATLAGSAERPNEDSYLASPEAMVPLDGAGGPSWIPNGCEHGTASSVHGFTALRWMEFTGKSPNDLLLALDDYGAAELLHQVRDLEYEDPDGIKSPRAKKRDDATLVDVHA